MKEIAFVYGCNWFLNGLPKGRKVAVDLHKVKYQKQKNYAEIKVSTMK